MSGSTPLQPQLVMVRETLADLPPVALPAGCALRAWRDEGDSVAWEQIVGAAFAWPEPAGSFDRIMRQDPAFAPDRVLFVCRDGEPVATASAWHQPSKGALLGYLHYVAKHPAEPAKGLGRQVSLACLHKMVAEGRTRAMLQTDDFRLPAIAVYLGLGFVPHIVHENQPERWAAVLAQLR